MAIPPNVLARIVVHVVSNKKIRNIILSIIGVCLGLVLLIVSSPFIIFSAIIDNGNGNKKDLNQEMSSYYDDFLEDIEEELKKDEHKYETIELIVMDSDENIPLDNRADVISLYALDNYKDKKVSAVLKKKDIRAIKKLYNEMNTITVEEEIEITYKEVEEMDDVGNIIIVEEEIIKFHKKVYVESKKALDFSYKYNNRELKILNELLSMASKTLGNNGNYFVSNVHIEKIKNEMPEDLDEIRKSVVNASLSLVGKVPYFWGGKYNTKGNNPSWGVPTIVSSAGSKTTGTKRPLGLDCSGFVTWAFINGGFESSTIGNVIGHGTYSQRNLSIPISKREAKIGDLVFVSDYSHVGIVVGYDENREILVVHENATDNNVDVDTASSVGVVIFRRPYIFN